MSRGTKRNAGSGLVTLLAAFSLLGFLAIHFSGAAATWTRLSKTTEMTEDFTTARMKVIERLDCNSTFSGVDCALNPSVVLRDSAGNPLTDSDGKIRSWKITATCSPSGLEIQAVWSQDKHPMNGNPLGPTRLLNTGSLLCKPYVAGLPSLRTSQVTIGKELDASGNPVSCLGTGKPAASNSSSVWRGSASCPADYIAVGGGVSCQPAPSVLVASGPNASPSNGWIGACCIREEDSSAPTFAPPRVSVQCARKE